MLPNVIPATATAAASPEPTRAVVLALLALPFASAAATPLVYRLLGERTAYFAAGVAAVCFGLVASLLGTQGVVAVEWIPSLGVALRFYVDGLALLIAFLASGVGVLILTYSGGYMHGESGQPRYYATLLAFMGSMLGVALAADLVALFVFWELTSVSSFLLIGHYYRTEPAQYAARKSMLVTVAGGLFMLAGFVVLHAVSAQALGEPTWNLVRMLEHGEAMRAALRETDLLVPVLVLVGIGAAAKSAQVPLHFWLPDAMEAPTPVSAFLHSATMVKAGVYLVGRLRPLLGTAEWNLLFATLGLATMTVAAVLAVAASDIKELLAYSTASHLGLIVAAFGFTAAFGGEEAGIIGAEAGALHILNHAVFKAALFLVAGIVAHEAGTRAIDELGGLRTELPVTAAITVVAALGMAGVPPFNGFYSKELLFEATWLAAEHAGGLAWVYPVVAVLGSVFTFMYSIRFLMLFFGEKPAALGEVHAPPRVMLAPPALLGGLAVVLMWPPIAVDVVVQAVFESAAAPPGTAGELPHVHVIPSELKPSVGMSALAIGLGAVGYTRYGRVRDGVRDVLATDPLRADWWYDTTVESAEVVGARLGARVHDGLVRTYAAWLLAALSALALGAYAAAGVGLPAFAGVAIAPATFVVLLVAVGAAGAVSRAPSHIAGVLSLSILGFMVAIFYILADAPDLALTQLVVETLLLVIFLLVLDRLPAFYGEAGRRTVLRDGALATAVGATVGLTVLEATRATPSTDIASYYLERAPVPEEHGSLLVDFGGGSNVVNVVLVDFRAFDTMGEISVVALAAVSVVTLVAMRERGETR